ncbi:MAG: WG repeat-containing protein, partial [Clostridiales Family XIII bacterium]|nr:WG repeat-containing protein [Clostridiales Family XIII bacterium]
MSALVIMLVYLLVGCGGAPGSDNKTPSGKGNGVFYAVAVDSQTRLCGFINEKGEWAIDPQFSYASDFTDNGLAAVAVKDPDSQSDPWEDA